MIKLRTGYSHKGEEFQVRGSKTLESLMRSTAWDAVY